MADLTDEPQRVAARPLHAGDIQKLIMVVATMIDTLRRELVYDDREGAIEKFQQLERTFTRSFLSVEGPGLLQAAEDVVNSLAQTPERERAMEALRAAVERSR